MRGRGTTRRGATRRGAMVIAAVGLLVLPMSCTDDEPFEDAGPILPTTAPTSSPDTSESMPTSDAETEQTDASTAGEAADPASDTEVAGADGETAADDATEDAAEVVEDGAAEDGADDEVAPPSDPADDEVPGAAPPAAPSPPTAAPPSNNAANRPAGAATNAGTGGGSTVSGPDLIASQPPPPEAPTPQPQPPPNNDVNVPPTLEPSPTLPPPELPQTCFGLTVDECTGEVIPEGAVTQMGEYQTNVAVPVGKAVDIYFDQARRVDEMAHLCDSMGGTFRQRGPDGSRWSGWWFCDDVVP